MSVAHRVGRLGATRSPERRSRAQAVHQPAIRWWVALALAALASIVSVSQARAQSATHSVAGNVSLEQPRMVVPFETGEKLTYDVRFGGIKVGTGRMEVVGLQDVRGREAWHTRFTVKGGIPLYKVNDRLESWIDTRTFESLRFVQDLQEGRRAKERTFEIYPDRGTYSENGEVEHAPSVDDPLDDAAFLYFVRTIPLEVGQTYEFNRYFRPDRNPVRIRVLRKETVTVPAGKFETIVIQPIIKSKGIFSEKGEAQMWLTNDPRRLLVQMKSNLSIGSLNLYLRGYVPGTVAMSADGSEP
jgi:HAMP domain-containing protein